MSKTIKPSESAEKEDILFLSLKCSLNKEFFREYNIQELKAMSKRELFDAYLRFQGIIGFSEEITRLFCGLYDIKIGD
jgi:hypothetical protein